MKTTWRYIQWLFWVLWYLPQPKRDLESFLIRSWRTRRPWWKFKPYLWRNNEGQMWQIYFSNEGDYTCWNIHVPCEVSFSRETGEVTGLNIFDGTLQRLAEDERMRQAARNHAK